MYLWSLARGPEQTGDESKRFSCGSHASFLGIDTIHVRYDLKTTRRFIDGQYERAKPKQMTRVPYVPTVRNDV
eukprot:1969632-Pyramimonas_sp.AAC.1